MTLTPPDPRAAMVVANVSGGKDSTALSLHLTELGIEHRRVFADTGWEHPDTYAYLDEIEKTIGAIDRVAPPLQMEALIRKKGMFPGRLHRYCTGELKVKPINKHMAEIDPEWRAIVAAIRERSTMQHVHAVELDPYYADRLAARFPDDKRLTVRAGSYLDEPAPAFSEAVKRLGPYRRARHVVRLPERRQGEGD